MGATEIRGFFYQALKDTFPGIGELIGPALAERLANIDLYEWYDIGPYLKAREFLTTYVSPEVLRLIGNRLIELYKDELKAKCFTTGAALAAALPDLYREWVRGDDAGEWLVTVQAPGCAVIKYTGEMASVHITAGVFKGALEAVGAYNIRVTILDTRADGGPYNTWVVEWIEGT